MDFEIARPQLTRRLSLRTAGRARLPFDPVMMMFKKSLSFRRGIISPMSGAEFLINDCLPFLRFLGLELSDRVARRPDDLAVPGETNEGRPGHCPSASQSGYHRHVGSDR